MKCYVLDGKEVPTPEVNESLGVPHIDFVNGNPQFDGRCCIVGGELPDIGDAGVVCFSASIPENIKKLEPRQVMLVGVRDLKVDDVHWIGRGARMYPLNTLMEEGIAEMSFTIMEAARQFNRLYVYVDTEVVDHPYGKVGGMASRELLFILHKLKLLNQFTVLHCAGGARDLIGKMVAEFY